MDYFVKKCSACGENHIINFKKIGTDTIGICENTKIKVYLTKAKKTQKSNAIITIDNFRLRI